MTVTFGGVETVANLCEFLRRREIGKRDIKLCVLHIHIYTDKSLFFGQSHTCINGVIEKVSYDNAQIKLAHFQFYGNMCIHLYRYAF